LTEAKIFFTIEKSGGLILRRLSARPKTIKNHSQAAVLPSLGDPLQKMEKNR